MIQFVFFCGRLLLPKAILTRSIHVVAYSYNSLIFIAYSILLCEQTASWLWTHLLLRWSQMLLGTFCVYIYIYSDMQIYIHFCWIYSYKWNCWITGDRALEIEAFNYVENSRNGNNIKLFPKCLYQLTLLLVGCEFQLLHILINT